MKRIIPIIIILAAIGGGYWWYTQNSTVAALETEEDPPLVGSGSIEAETVAITAELGGRIIDLMADEGEEVAADQILVELDKSDLLAQQLQLEAALATAKANLEAVSASARPEDIAVAEAQLQQAKVTRDGLKIIWETVNALVNDPKALDAQINQAETRVTEAEKAIETALVRAIADHGIHSIAFLHRSIHLTI
jgi:multidrug efflux pump subunit AcrA (membrane-fusion protein)